LHVLDAKRGESFVLHPWDADTHAGWRHYVEVVARRFSRNFPGAPLGADIAVESDLPRASGMSSSSALIVAIAQALVLLGDIGRHPQWRANIQSPVDMASYFGCLENGMPFGTLAGDAGVGTHGGSEDHAAIVMSVPGTLSAFRFVPMRPIENVRVPAEWRFVLSPCGIAARKTGTEMHKYNQLSEGARLLLEVWNSSQSHADSLAAIAASAEQTTRLRQMIRETRIAGWSARALQRRLDHFVREDARIPQAVHAIHTFDAAALSRLADESQQDAEVLLGNQIPETIALARSARELGAFAACSFGAGFGGSVWALVDGARAADFAARWHAEAFVASPGPPLTRL
jgi:galactokinase